MACLLLTTMGRVLLQCERSGDDTALPFHVPRLALLLASLLQFATARADFARLQLKNGFSVVLSVDSAASVACAVIYHSGSGGERARLQSLVVLRAFVNRFHERLERLVETNRADAARMADEYTPTSALSDRQRADGGDCGGLDGTLDEFVAFQHGVVASVLETEAAEQDDDDHDDDDVGGAAVAIAVVNAETFAPLTPWRQRRPHAAHELARRAARALQLAFPVLFHSSLLKRRGTARLRGVGLESATISATAVVLRLETTRAPQASERYVAIRMFHLGVFASVSHFCTTENASFRGRECELLRDGQLQRALVADARGAALLRLLHEAETSRSFALHVGADAIPERVAERMERSLAPWARAATA